MSEKTLKNIKIQDFKISDIWIFHIYPVLKKI